MILQQGSNRTRTWSQLVGLRLAIVCATASLCLSSTARAEEPSPSYNLPSVDLNERVLWGSVCEPGDGLGLSFGGEDQEARDGRSHTRVMRSGNWVEIRSELEQANPWQATLLPLLLWDFESARIAAGMRSDYFSGHPAAREQETLEKLMAIMRIIFREVESAESPLAKRIEDKNPQDYPGVQAKVALIHLENAHWSLEKLSKKASQLKA